jgi:hypothetical protein
MAVETSPAWDPTGTLRVRVDAERRELVVAAGGERIAFALRCDRPDRLGWVRLSPPRRRVAVSEVVAHCLREWDAEQEVLAISVRAAVQASRRGGAWCPAAKRLRAQVGSARRSRRLAVLPFQLLWRQLAERDSLPSISRAALRAGFRMPDGRADTIRLQRRLGLKPCRDGRGRPSRNSRINYATGVALCRALGRDPAELGL